MRTLTRHFAAALTLLTLTLGGAGCSGMKNGSMDKVQAITTNQRVGSVYLLRGWIGIFSTGIDELGKQVDTAGVHSEVYQEVQWSSLADAMIAKYEADKNHEPIVIIGHSYGADDAILITRKLAEHNIKVDLVITLDPVTPRKVPSNINLVYNLYQSSALDGLPFLRGIPLTAETPGPVALRNMNIRTDRKDLLEPGLDHFNIEKKEKIHTDVLAQVLKVCQPRSTWAMSHPFATHAAVAVAAKPSPAAAVVPTAKPTPAGSGVVITTSMPNPPAAGAAKVDAVASYNR